MNQQFEQQLTERLHAHPDPEPATSLDLTSIALGERMRRRRIGAVVAVLVLLLAIPGVTATWMRVSNTDRPPVTSPTTPAVPEGPRSLILDPAGRELGPDIEVSTVREGAVWVESGSTLPLPRNQVGSVAEFGSGAAWLARSGNEVSLNLMSTPLPIATDQESVSGVDAGPVGSVMVRTDSGPLIWTLDGALVRPSLPILRTTDLAATATALWATTGEGVARVDMSDLSVASYPTESFTDWKTVVSGDPVSDRVIVTDAEGCQAILDGSTAEPVWRTCDWEILALSPDGTLAAARNVQHRTLEIVDVATGKLRLLIDHELNPVGPVVVFDRQNRLNIRMGADGIGYGFITIELTGECWFSAPGPYGTAVEFVTPNR